MLEVQRVKLPYSKYLEYGHAFFQHCYASFM